MSDLPEVPVEPVAEEAQPVEPIVEEQPVELTLAEGDKVEQRDIRIGVGYDDESKLFILRWEDNGTGFFESRMDQQNFEALTGRFVRILQQVNLAQAVEYQNRKADDEKSQGETPAVEGDAGGVQDLPCADGQDQAEPEQPKND